MRKLFLSILVFAVLFAPSQALAVRPGTTAERVLKKVQQVVNNPNSVIENGSVGQGDCGEDNVNQSASLRSHRLFQLIFLDPEDYLMTLHMNHNPYNELYLQELNEVLDSFDELEKIIYKEAESCNTPAVSALEKKYIEFTDPNLYQKTYEKKHPNPKDTLYFLRSDGENDPAYDDLTKGDANGKNQSYVKNAKAAKKWTLGVNFDFKKMYENLKKIAENIAKTNFKPEDFKPYDDKNTGKKLWDKRETPTETIFFWEDADDKVATKTIKEYFALKSFCAGQLHVPECKKFCEIHMPSKEKTFCVTPEEYKSEEQNFGENDKGEFIPYLQLKQDDKIVYGYDLWRAQSRSRYYDLYFNVGLTSNYTLSERNRTVVSILNRTNYDTKPEGGFLVEKYEAIKFLAEQQCPNRKCEKAEKQPKKEQPEKEESQPPEDENPSSPDDSERPVYNPDFSGGSGSSMDSYDNTSSPRSDDVGDLL